MKSIKKILVFILMVISHINTISGQEKWIVIIPVNQEVHLYEDAVSHTIKHTIFQDSVFEIYFDAKILTSTPLRFEIEVSSTILPCFPDVEITTIRGWIDKINCGIFLRNIYSPNNNPNRPILNIYSEPTTDSHYITLTGYYNQLVNVLDYSGDWAKVIFYDKGKLIIGWIERYCSNIYNSCT